MNRNDVYARLSEVPSLTPAQRVAIVNAMTDTQPADLPPGFRSGVTTDLGTRFIRPEDRGQFPTAEQAMAETSPIQIDDLETATIVVPGPETIAAGEEFIAGMADPLDFQDGPPYPEADNYCFDSLPAQDVPDLDDDRDGTFVDGDWLYEATFLVALHATTANPATNNNCTEHTLLVAIAHSIAKKAVESMS